MKHLGLFMKFSLSLSEETNYAVSIAKISKSGMESAHREMLHNIVSNYPTMGNCPIKDYCFTNRALFINWVEDGKLYTSYPTLCMDDLDTIFAEIIDAYDSNGYDVYYSWRLNRDGVILDDSEGEDDE